jgi:hypothetical protein
MKNFKLSFLILMTLVFFKAAAQVPSYVPSNGLIGWWPFNGNANDESGNGNNGTVNGATLTADRFGMSSSAFSFDGLNDFISTNYAGIAGKQNRTIQFWAKHSQSFDPNKCVSCSRLPAISYGSNVTGPSEIGKGIYCDFNVGANGVGFDGNESYATFDAVNKVNDNKWHHYVYVLESISNVTSIKIYQDSQLLTKILYTYLGTNSVNTKLQVPLQFGIRTYNTSGTHPNNYYKGELDDIGFWDRALTTKEVASLYKGTLSNRNSNCDLIKKACFYVEPKAMILIPGKKWQKLNDFPSVGRYAKSFVINGEGYVIGGLTNTSTLDECWKYNVTKDTWIRVANVPKSANIFTTFTIDSIGYAFYDSVLYAYNPRTNQWSNKKNLSGVDVWNSAAFAVKGKGYMVSTDLKVHSYDPTTNSWTRKSDFPGTGRTGNVAFAINDKGYYGLGIVGGNNVCQNDMWEYDPTADKWTQKANFPSAGTYTTFSCTDGTLGYLVGGETTNPNSAVKDFYIYDPVKDTYAKDSNFLGGDRNYITGFMLNNVIYCGFGGFGYFNDFYRYATKTISKYVTYKWSTGDTGLSTCVNPNYTQLVTVTDGECIDTMYLGWNKQSITIYDTVKIKVTDTLLINVTFSNTKGIQTNVVKVYPNPTSSELHIDFNDYSSILGYNVEIYNASGQTVYNSTVTQQKVTINLSSWTGKGTYFVKITDKAGKAMETKKIVLQ